MLLRTMFLLALFAIVAETIVHGAAALAQAALHQRALDAARTAFAGGVRAAQASVAQTIASNPAATAFPLPAPAATCAYADGGGCALNVQTTFASPTPAPSAQPAACPQTDCTIVLQESSAVAESRASLIITTIVTAASGAPLATRSGVASFRTYAVPPYASLVGGVDATVDALMNGGAADDAGSPSSLITVQYQPSGGGASISGNVWQSQNEVSATAAPAWDR